MEDKADKKTLKLFKAVEKEDLKKAEKYLEAGADPNCRIRHEKYWGYINAFSVACMHSQNYEMARLLYSYGAEVVSGDKEMAYPLLLVCRRADSGQTALVEFLIDKGADVNYDVDFDTPLNSICSIGCNSYYSSEGLKTSVKTCKLLIDKGAKVKESIANGNYLLHDSVQFINAGIAKLLIESGADANQIAEFENDKGKYYETPLITLVKNYDSYYAEAEFVRREIAELATLLIKNGADKAFKDIEGFTALEIAQKNDINYLYDILK